MKRKYKHKLVRCSDCKHLRHHTKYTPKHLTISYPYTCLAVPSHGWVSNDISMAYHTCGVYEKATSVEIAKMELLGQ